MSEDDGAAKISRPLIRRADEPAEPVLQVERRDFTDLAPTDRPRALAYGCRCSRQRLSGILEGFARDDLDHMAVDGDIVMTCEFCNLDFRFDRTEVRGKAEEA